MLDNGSNGKQRNGGFSLIEMLVASAVFAIAAAVAFILYSAAQKSYKTGENLADQQQSTRVAFDRLISDLRLAGFNYNPDGDTTRVDEQIEGAWDTAVTIRGDFDFEDPTASTTPESSLPGSVYSLVSTGNDEIVTYVLAKDGATGPDTLTLRLDTDRPRTRTVKTVIIPNVAVVQDDPPYTLYRVTLTDVNGAFPNSPQAASDFVYEPVADNIKSMTFTYYSEGGTMIGPDTPANPADDIGGDDPNIDLREDIRKISVSLVGMTPDPDPQFVDATDAVAATQHYRKFELTSEVNSENLGKKGIQDLDSNPPPAPTNVATVPGHCKGMLLTWDDPAASSGISNYAVRYYPSSSPTSVAFLSFPYPHSDFGVIDYDAHAFASGLTVGTNYCFQVQAKDSTGNESAWSPSGTPICETVAEASTPGTPQNFIASGSGTLEPKEIEIALSWDQIKSNAGTVTGDPDTFGGATILRDPLGYKIYKSTVSASFTPDDATNLLTPTPLSLGTTSFVDSPVEVCEDRYYKLVAVDTCDVASAPASAVGRAETDVPPATPGGLVGARVSSQNVEISWNSVAKRADGSAAKIGHYEVYGYLGPSGLSPTSIPPANFSPRGAVDIDPKINNVVYTDTLDAGEVGAINQDKSLYYAVKAVDACPNYSELSAPIEIFCNFKGNLISDPYDGEPLNVGVIPIQLSMDTSGKFTRARVRISDPLNPGSFVYDQEIFSGGPWSFPSWDATSATPGDYTIFWEVEDDGGCTKSVTTTHTLYATLACQVTPTNPNLNPTSGKPNLQNTTLSWDVVNSAGRDLEILQVYVSWSSNLSTSRKLKDVQWPTGTSVAAPGALNPVMVDFSFFPLLLPATMDGLCANLPDCVINMTLGWDDQVLDPSSGVGELITVRYFFRNPDGATGSCEFTIYPDLTIDTGGGGSTSPLPAM